MQLYVIHDDPENKEWFEDRYCLAIWSNCEEDAVSLYGEYYDSPEKPSRDQLAVKTVEVAANPAKDGRTHIEHRAEVLRLAGFLEEGERACDCCNLYACGLKEYRVCPECEMCPECGHAVGCGESEG